MSRARGGGEGAPPPATTMPSQEGVLPSRWSSKLWSQVCTPRNRSLQVGIKALLVHFCIRAAAARRRGESDKRGPNSCVWALSTAAPHQRQRLLNVASSRRGNSYMSSLELVITIARRVLHQQRGVWRQQCHGNRRRNRKLWCTGESPRFCMLDATGEKDLE